MNDEQFQRYLDDEDFNAEAVILQGKMENYGSIITIIFLIAAIISILRFFANCAKPPADILAMRHGRLAKIKLRQAIKKGLSKEDYATHGENLYKSILDRGSEIKEQEFATLLKKSVELEG